MVDNISLGKGRKAQQLDLAKMQQGGIIREAKNEKMKVSFQMTKRKFLMLPIKMVEKLMEYLTKKN